MSHPPLPKNCYEIETAAQLLEVSAKKLYEFLRNKNWLNAKKKHNDKAHNLPKPWAKQMGYVRTQERGYQAPYNKNVQIIYHVTLLTNIGLQEVARLMNKEINLPKIPDLTLEHAQQAQAVPAAGDEEREKAMAKLREWGIAS